MMRNLRPQRGFIAAGAPPLQQQYRVERFGHGRNRL
jgi:hypothetical protein